MTVRRPVKQKSAQAPQPPDEAISLPLAERLSFLVHTAGARIANIGNRHFRDHDLNHYSARILVMLLEHVELRTGELVERMVLPQSTISSQLQALHKKRLIRRRRSRLDNRLVNLTLTPAGMELARDCNALSLRVHHEVVADMSERECQQGFAFLRKINERLVALEQQDLYPFRSVAQGLREESPSGPSTQKPAPRPRAAAISRSQHKHITKEQTA